MVLFSIETAIRKGELLQMRHDHINFDKHTLLIPETKTGKPRTIPLSPKAIEILQSMPRRLDGKITWGKGRFLVGLIVVIMWLFF